MKKSAIILMVCLVATFALPSCEKVGFEQMLECYEEALVLKGQPVDSIERFSMKVEAFVNEFPDQREQLLYPKILESIQKAKLYWSATYDTTGNDKHSITH